MKAKTFFEAKGRRAWQAGQLPVAPSHLNFRQKWWWKFGFYSQGWIKPLTSKEN